MLRGKPKIDGRPGDSLAPLDFDKLRTDLEEKHGRKLRYAPSPPPNKHPATKTGMIRTVLVVDF